ncbi:hypothetical protein ACDA63_02970 [Uliginosibacterium sp. sgz301328]|uniref:hypothetical protein n=1 Tax=Uliginosibacterium sp. sgz301328 TaxID=3243764 RepID=UPI00359D096A
MIRSKRLIRLLALPLFIACATAVAQQTESIKAPPSTDVPLNHEWRNGPAGMPSVTDDRLVTVASAPTVSGNAYPCSLGKATVAVVAMLACGFSGRCAQTGPMACDAPEAWRRYR